VEYFGPIVGVASIVLVVVILLIKRGSGCGG
jgi:hypothetical protein